MIALKTYIVKKSLGVTVMPYILENVKVFENETMKETNFIVKEGLFYSRGTPVRKLSFMRLQLDKQKVITACDTAFADLGAWEQKGTDYAEELVLNGYTTVIFPVDLAYEYQLDNALNKARSLLEDFPLDYVLIIRAPATLIKPSLIRKCKARHIPALIMKLGHMREMHLLDWSRLREASFPYKLLWIPEFPEGYESSGQPQWKRIASEAKLPHSEASIPLHEALGKPMLKKIGLYPYKGILRAGGEVSYHIMEDNAIQCLNIKRMAYYDKIDATVYKNKVIRYGARVDLSKAHGKELEIRVPGYFQ